MCCGGVYRWTTRRIRAMAKRPQLSKGEAIIRRLEGAGFHRIPLIGEADHPQVPRMPGPLAGVAQGLCHLTATGRALAAGRRGPPPGAAAARGGPGRHPRSVIAGLRGAPRRRPGPDGSVGLGGRCRQPGVLARKWVNDRGSAGNNQPGLTFVALYRACTPQPVTAGMQARWWPSWSRS
jgi:hypothetical protein